MKKFAMLLVAIPTVFLATAARGDPGWSIQLLFSRCVPFCGALNGVNMLNGKIGIVVGGGYGALSQPYSVTLFSEDGGAHWIEGSVPLGSGSLSKVEFIDQTTAVSVGAWNRDGEGTILRTTDRGATWTSVVSGTRNRLTGVSFADAKIGTAVGDGGTILRTAEGGLTWIAQSSGTTNNLYDVSSIDGNAAVAVGDGGTVLRTIDGGNTWILQASGTKNQLRAVSFTDFNTGITVGSGGLILHTTDGGETWLPQVSGTSANLLSVAYTDDPNTAFVGSVGSILRTTDGGATWIQQELPTVAGVRSWSGISIKDGIGIAVSDRIVLRTLTGGDPVTCTAGIDAR